MYTVSLKTILIVTQVDYFDFWGASLRGHFPWVGGMKSFLRSIARWEQEQKTLLKLKGLYDEE